MHIPDPHAAAIQLLEGAGHYQTRIKRIADWPNLTAGQKMLAFTINSLEHAWGRLPAPFEVGRVLKWDPDQVSYAFKGSPDAPFLVVTEGAAVRFQPHASLEA